MTESWKLARIVRRKGPSGTPVVAARAALSRYPAGLRFSLSRAWHPSLLASANAWLRARRQRDLPPSRWLLTLNGPAGDLEWSAPAFGTLLVWPGPYPLWVAPWAVVGACGTFTAEAQTAGLPLRRVSGTGELILSSPGEFLPLEVEAGQHLNGSLLAAWHGEPDLRRVDSQDGAGWLEARRPGLALLATRQATDLAALSLLPLTRPS